MRLRFWKKTWGVRWWFDAKTTPEFVVAAVAKRLGSDDPISFTVMRSTDRTMYTTPVKNWFRQRSDGEIERGA